MMSFSSTYCSMSSKNGAPYAEGGEYSDGYITFGTRSFGPYTAMVDSLAPTIKPHNIFSGKNMSTTDHIILKISDNLSGIEAFNGYVDDKWVLFEYDKKSHRLTYHYSSESLEKGNHTLRMEVVDKVGNENSYQASFTY